MSFVIKYHLLFEVRILHGFHFKDEEAFYTRTEDKKAEELINNNYNILNDLEIVPTDDCQKLLKGHRLRFKTTSLGFMVGAETKVSTSGDLLPFLPITVGTVFHFKIRLKNSNWSNISNVKLKPTTKARFYFTNFEQLVDLKSALQTNPIDFRQTLSLEHENHNEERPYEMGEIVLVGNNLKRAIQNADGSDLPSDVGFWEPLKDINNISETDRKLLPSRFNYQVVPKSGVSVDEIEFDLFDSNSDLVKMISFDSLNGKTIVNLDFRKIENERQVNLLPGEYTLQISSPSTTFQETKKIHIDDDLFDLEDWGVIAIAHQPNLEKHRILEDDGKLRIESRECSASYF